MADQIRTGLDWEDIRVFIALAVPIGLSMTRPNGPDPPRASIIAEKDKNFEDQSTGMTVRQ